VNRAAALIPAERIAHAILLIRGERVMLDADLAVIYGVTTKRLNEQVKRNRDRFPTDFVFQLTEAEKTEVVTNCDHLARLKFSRQRPYAFTEPGARIGTGRGADRATAPARRSSFRAKRQV
jgi:hypothetical protein